MLILTAAVTLVAPVTSASAANSIMSTKGGFSTTGSTNLPSAGATLSQAGDLLVIWVKSRWVTNAPQVHITGINASGTGAIGTPVKAIQYFTVNHPNNDDEIWFAPVTSAGSVTLSFTWSGSTSSDFNEYSTQEFQPSTPSTYSLDIPGSYEAPLSTTIQFPPLTPSSADELYAGYNSNSSTANYSSPTSGYAYQSSKDGDAIIYGPDVGQSLQSPSLTASPGVVQSSVGALIIATPANQHTVIFNGNGGSGTMNAETASAPTTLTSNAFVYAGRNFAGWNTAANGTGTPFADSATYPFAANATLYAQWTSSVTFSPNGATSGSMGIETSSTPANLSPNAFVDTGHSFAGWNTAANGTGTPFADGAVYPFTANVTLYAQWTVDVTFNGNGATSGSMGIESHNVPSSLTLNAFVDTGHSFAGWNTAEDGSGTTYLDGATFPFLTATTLYAQWTADYVDVTFDGNGATGGSMGVQNDNAPSALASNAFVDTGHSFAGWNTAANGSGTAYADGAVYPFTANVTLYAQWTANSYKVSFNGNGATGGSMKAETYNKPTALSPNNFVKAGYTFIGWNTAANGSGVRYAGGARYPFTSAVTLYARWKADSYKVTFNGNGATSGSMTAESDNAPKALTSNAFAKTSYSFAGWNTLANGKGTAYANRVTYPFKHSVTLYAQWTGVTPRATHLVGSIIVGQSRHVTIIGSGFFPGSHVKSNERGLIIRVLEVGATKLTLMVSVGKTSPLGRHAFIIVTPANKTCAISYVTEK